MTEIPPVYGNPTEAAAQLARIFEATGCRTQLELAAFLDIRQTALSAATRRGKIPADWLITLLCVRGINPAWIMSGIGPKFLAPSHTPAETNYSPGPFPPVRAIDAEIVRKVLLCFPARDLEGELRRRKGAPKRLLDIDVEEGQTARAGKDTPR